MPIKIFTVAEMVAAEKVADAAGHSYDTMMEQAGKALADAIIERYPVDGLPATMVAMASSPGAIWPKPGLTSPFISTKHATRTQTPTSARFRR